jgi:hypothetical protein
LRAHPGSLLPATGAHSGPHVSRLRRGRCAFWTLGGDPCMDTCRWALSPSPSSTIASSHLAEFGWDGPGDGLVRSRLRHRAPF